MAFAVTYTNRATPRQYRRDLDMDQQLQARCEEKRRSTAIWISVAGGKEKSPKGGLTLENDETFVTTAAKMAAVEAFRYQSLAGKTWLRDEIHQRVTQDKANQQQQQDEGDNHQETAPPLPATTARKEDVVVDRRTDAQLAALLLHDLDVLAAVPEQCLEPHGRVFYIRRSLATLPLWVSRTANPCL